MSQKMTLQWIQRSSLCRSVSPLLAALLTLQVSGCAFHSYQDVDKSDWPQIEKQKQVRVTMSDRTIHTGQFAVLRPALDTTSLTDSLILASPDSSQSPVTLIITNTRMAPTDTVGFKRTKAVTDSTYIAVGEINRVEVQKGATTANATLAIAAVALIAALFLVGLSDAMGDALGEAAAGAFSGNKSNAAGHP